MHVVLFEPNYHGHRLVHIRRMLPTLASLPVKITLVTGAASRGSREYQDQIAPLEHLLTLHEQPAYPLDDGAAYIKRAALEASRVVRTLRPDHMYVPYADGTVQHMGMRRLTGRFPVPRGVELEGLMMRGEFAYAQSPGLKARLRHAAWIQAVAASPFRTIHHMDPIIAEAMRARSSSLASRVRLIADPVEAFGPMSKAEARRRLGVPTDGRYIGCVGYQDTRKGIDLLIRAFIQADLPPSDRLLLPGGQEKPVKALLEGEAAPAVASGRIIPIGRYISDEELMISIAALDVVATAYPPNAGHVGSSSIVIHAASQGRPVLGTEHGWVGQTIRRFGLGDTCDVLHTDMFARAIRASLDRSMTYRQGEAGRRFAEFHRPENFVASFLRRLRERLNLPQPQGLRDWSWVLEASEDRGSVVRAKAG